MITFTKEERQALLVQVGYRIDYFKKEAVECKSFSHIEEIMRGLQPLESAYKKLLEEKI